MTLSMQANAASDTVRRVRNVFEKSVAGASIDVIEVTSEHIIARDEYDRYWKIAIQIDQDEITVAERAAWGAIKLTFVDVSQQAPPGPARVAVRESYEGVFAGSFPQVPYAPGVDVKALLGTDPDPMFLTLPVVRVGEISKNGMVHDRDFTLEAIDLAPFSRAAMPGEGSFMVTQEMQDHVESEDKPMTTVDVLAGLKVTDLPDALRQAVIDEYEVAQQHTRQIAELTQERGTLEARIQELEQANTTAQQRVAELEKLETDRQAVAARQVFELAVTTKAGKLLAWEKATDDTVLARRAALEKMFIRSVLAELGNEQAEDQMNTVFETLWESEFKVMAETLRDASAGPPAIVAGQTASQSDLHTPLIADTPENRARMKARFGFS